jgi:hypothetical protein
VDTAVLMEIENLRRASLASLREKYQEVFQEETRCRHREHLFRRVAWRLQALAEGDLSQRARGRAHQIAQDADLRKVAPRDFFTVEGEPVETTRGYRKQDRRLPLPGAVLTLNVLVPLYTMVDAVQIVVTNGALSSAPCAMNLRSRVSLRTEVI